MTDWSAPFEVFYDGECGLCRREIQMLDWLDRKDRIVFTDIAAPDFDGEGTVGLSYDVLMAEIHGRTAAGEIVTGVEVFRQLYGRVGLRYFVWISRVPIIKQMCDAGYVLFARNRLRLTGRCARGDACRIPVDRQADPS